jgi:hypothetical protein
MNVAEERVEVDGPAVVEGEDQFLEVWSAVEAVDAVDEGALEFGGAKGEAAAVKLGGVVSTWMTPEAP